VRFEKALLMSQKLGDLLLQRRALRGLAASSRMQVLNHCHAACTLPAPFHASRTLYLCSAALT
jgi:hypothetical protein